MFKIEYAKATHKGSVREKNEDRVRVIKSKKLFLVADGLGAPGRGDVASSTAVEVASKKFNPSQPASFYRMFRHAHEAVFEGNKGIANPAKFMGTTLAALHFSPNGKVLFGNVGDSRIYIKRGNRLVMLSEDHLDPLDRCLTQTIGGQKEAPTPKFRELYAKHGDVFLLCSDGLTNQVSEKEINEIISRNSLGKAVRELVKRANAHGGYDNVSVALIKFREEKARREK
ncbi:MAG: PP2C family protein-serine/threonine phosphatase [Candidatus Norongarragalinales archaeon]